MSSEATEGQIPDQYGQLHPVETPELLERKRLEFEDELKKLPNSNCIGLDQAKEKCPQLLTDDFKLMFLRCEVFNADLAAKRYAQYWDKRIEICGPEKAFLPFALDGALKDDWTALTQQFIQCLPPKEVSDEKGRSLILLDPSKQDKTKYERLSMARTLWYMVHAALEDNVNAQKHGIVILAFMPNAKLTQLDRELSKINIGSIQGALPVRVAAIHLCRPPSFFKIIMAFLRLTMSKRMQQRMLVHFGDDQKVLEKLSMYGLGKEMIPSYMGGSLQLDLMSWLEERKSKGK